MNLQVALEELDICLDEKLDHDFIKKKYHKRRRKRTRTSKLSFRNQRHKYNCS